MANLPHRTSNGEPSNRKSQKQNSEKLHRIQTVRQQQGVTLRTVARQTGIHILELRKQEREECDLSLSDLQKWQKCLDVPMSELLSEPDESLSRPVMERAQLVRLMKTATNLLQLAESINTKGNPSESRVEQLARTMVEQLIEIMPELKDVVPRHTYTKRCGVSQYGRIVERQFSDNYLTHMDEPVS